MPKQDAAKCYLKYPGDAGIVNTKTTINTSHIIRHKYTSATIESETQLDEDYLFAQCYLAGLLLVWGITRTGESCFDSVTPSHFMTFCVLECWALSMFAIVV